ncbi:MAG: PilZ domain-containing protein [Candidatus Sericytochromatia bacterium]|nr:PilZ domain-containing protein [Candidatus Tanganyikabacteria bacterium]
MYEGRERRKHPRIKCNLPVDLIPPDSAVPVRGTVANLSTGGMLAVLFRPIPYFGLEPYEARFRLGEIEVALRGNWEVRGNARVVALEFLPGQEQQITHVRAYIREHLMADDGPTGRTTRRVTLPRRDEAITIRRMLKQGTAGACDPYLDESLEPAKAAGGGAIRTRLAGIARILGF